MIKQIKLLALLLAFQVSCSDFSKKDDTILTCPTCDNKEISFLKIPEMLSSFVIANFPGWKIPEASYFLSPGRNCISITERYYINNNGAINYVQLDFNRDGFDDYVFYLYKEIPIPPCSTSIKIYTLQTDLKRVILSGTSKGLVIVNEVKTGSGLGSLIEMEGFIPPIGYLLKGKYRALVNHSYDTVNIPYDGYVKSDGLGEQGLYFSGEEWISIEFENRYN